MLYLRLLLRYRSCCCDIEVVVASVLAVVYKRMQQLPAMLGATVHRVKDKTHKTLESVCNARTWPQQCWESCATDQTLLRYASAITERRKCWQLLTQKFDKFQILRNNFQQHMHNNMQ